MNQNAIMAVYGAPMVGSHMHATVAPVTYFDPPQFEHEGPPLGRSEYR